MSATPKPFSVVYNPDDGFQYEFATGYISIPMPQYSATSSNTPNTIVKRDGSGSFSAQVISSVQSLVNSDNINNGGAQDTAQLVIRGSSFPQEQIQVGYNTSGQYGYLQAAIYGFSTQPIALQPIGGSVLIGTVTQDTSATFQINSTSQGMLPPRMTNTQRDAIATPGEGLTIYSLTDHALEFWNGTVWKVVATV